MVYYLGTNSWNLCAPDTSCIKVVHGNHIVNASFHGLLVLKAGTRLFGILSTNTFSQTTSDLGAPVREDALGWMLRWPMRVLEKLGFATEQKEL